MLLFPFLLQSLPRDGMGRWRPVTAELTPLEHFFQPSIFKLYEKKDMWGAWVA